MSYLRDDLKWGCCQQPVCWESGSQKWCLGMSTLDSTIDAFLRPAKGRLIQVFDINTPNTLGELVVSNDLRWLIFFLVKSRVSKTSNQNASQAQHLWWIVLSQALMVNCDDLTRCYIHPRKTNMCPEKFGPFQSQYGISWIFQPSIFRGHVSFQGRCVDLLSIHFLGGFHPGTLGS